MVLQLQHNCVAGGCLSNVIARGNPESEVHQAQRLFQPPPSNIYDQGNEKSSFETCSHVWHIIEDRFQTVSIYNLISQSLPNLCFLKQIRQQNNYVHRSFESSCCTDLSFAHHLEYLICISVGKQLSRRGTQSKWIIFFCTTCQVLESRPIWWQRGYQHWTL